MSYPVSLTVQPSIAGRNRITTLFRLVLALPHLLLVGGVAVGVATSSTDMGGEGSVRTVGGEGGLLGAVVVILVVISWFTIVFGGTHLPALRQFTAFYLRWRARALAYFMLLTDDYPPFGDAPYPASLDVREPAVSRNRLSVAFRFVLAFPHFIAMAFVHIGWALTTAVAWFAILFTGTYPAMLYDFGVGALRWRLRLEAYLFLLVDDYPPFSLK